MKSERFKIGRPNGKSNAQTILDYVSGGTAGQIYTYAELAAALSAGADHDYSRTDVQAVVTGMWNRQLSEQSRVLHNIRNVGYRLSAASDHRMLALVRKEKADVQLTRGLSALRNVKWSEFTDEQRKAHEAQLMISEALWSQQQALERRMKAVEDTVKSIAG